MRTKEEMFSDATGDSIGRINRFKDAKMYHFSANTVFDLMSEYSKQQSISFAKFIGNSGWRLERATTASTYDTWYNLEDKKLQELDLTHEQLYEKFIESQNKV